MRKNYYCRMDIAVKCGADAAILLHEFVRLVLKNKAENRSFAENRYWVCVSLNELADRYPLWSKRQIERLLKILRGNHFLLADRFNIDPRDRTCWYSPSDEILALYEDYPWDEEE